MSGILRFGRWRQIKLLRKFEAFLDHMRLSKSRHTPSTGMPVLQVNSLTWGIYSTKCYIFLGWVRTAFQMESASSLLN